ncbi:hypothetical protein DFS33DRAFT_1365000 [Desarmillaria ectypa]|nr:hypothetical protein DFS33DRAFT_1365000 [Desarmillaria ectypa]
MSLLQFRDFLLFGERQRISSYHVYSRIVTSPNIQHALNIPSYPHIPHADESWIGIYIEDRDSMILRSDPYFLLLLRHLKDEHVPINSMHLKGVNWFNFPNPSAFCSAIISFPHICVLSLASITCSKNDMKCLVTSLPNLIRLNLKGGKLQGEGVTMTIPQGPTLESLSISVIDGEYGVWDLFISPESPADLSALRRINIDGDGARVVYDRTMVHRIQALLDFTESSLKYFDIGYINMNEGLLPLHIEDVQELSVIISLTGETDQMNRCVQWWTTTFLALSSENRLDTITIEIAVDQHRIQGGSVPLCNPHFWNALDEALCRREVGLNDLKFYIHAKPSPYYVTGYDYAGVMYWLCKDCLPRCRAKYESAFTLLDEFYEEVDLPI